MLLSFIHIICFSYQDPIALRELLTTENVGERLENGLTLLHLCCVSRQTWSLFLAAEKDCATSSSLFAPDSTVATVSAAKNATPRVSPCPMHVTSMTEDAHNFLEPTMSLDQTSPCILQLSVSKLKDKNKAVKKIQKLISGTLNDKELGTLENKSDQQLTKADFFKSDQSIKPEMYCINNPVRIDNSLYKAKKSTKTETTSAASLTATIDTANLNDAVNCVKLLLEKGADTAIISKNGFSPLHLAAYQVT